MTSTPTRSARYEPPVDGRRGHARRWLLAISVVIAVIGGAVVGIRAWWDDSVTEPITPGCTIGAYRLTTDQAAIAADLVAVVIHRSLPARASTLLVTAAIQESRLRNVPAGQGDRDSIGVLQQRPSQGWGAPEQLADPTYAAGAFLDRVVQVPDWQTAPAADVIQAVQISIDGTLYAQHEAEGIVLASALDGTTPQGISCTFAAPTLVAPANLVADRIAAALPVTAPSVDGQRIDVDGAGWPTAAWSVAHADLLGIDRVGCGGRSWTRTSGWTDDPDANADGVSITMALEPGS